MMYCELRGKAVENCEDCVLDYVCNGRPDTLPEIPTMPDLPTMADEKTEEVTEVEKDPVFEITGRINLETGEIDFDDEGPAKDEEEIDDCGCCCCGETDQIADLQDEIVELKARVEEIEFDLAWDKVCELFEPTVV